MLAKAWSNPDVLQLAMDKLLHLDTGLSLTGEEK